MGANAQTSVPSFSASQILTAQQMNESARTGVPVFADTTARDAGFGGAGEKTLAEGQLCYLESTNVVQYYDGSAWATLAPGPITNVQSATVNTQQSTSSTSYTDLATSGPTVTITTGTTALVIISATFLQAGADAGLLASFAVSGATTLSASDDNGISGIGTSTERYGQMSSSRAFILTGLTGGSNTFTMKYRVTASTASFLRRSLVVMAL